MSDQDEMNEFYNKVAEGDGEKKRIGRSQMEEPCEVACDGPNPKEKVNAKMWAVNEKAFFPCEKAVNALPPNLYTIGFSPESGIFFSESQVTVDELLELPDTASQTVIEEVNDFKTKENHFRQLGFLWKRGFLLWGPPGSGKTSCVHLVSKQLVAEGGIGIFVTNPDLATKALAMLRRVEPNRLIFIILEDLDAIVSEHGEANLLALMDGETQIDNVVYVATTNYPERLDQRIINRPSRFDLIKKIGMPTAAAREMYLKHKYPKIAKDADVYTKWVKQTDGFSIAHLKELIVSVEVFSRPFEEVVKRLKTMMERTPESADALKSQFKGFMS